MKDSSVSEVDTSGKLLTLFSFEGAYLSILFFENCTEERSKVLPL